MDRLRALRYFEKLAATLSFSETAKHFQVPSSSVSRRIKDLENELDAALFARTTRTVRLTDLGKLYLVEVASALRTLDLADEIVHAQSKAPTGTVRITAMPNYAELFVLPAVDRLRQLYTEIDFDLNITDEVVSLSGNEVDVAIRATAEPPEQVVARYLRNNEFVLVASPEYIARCGAPTASNELSARPVFMYRTPRGVLNWLTSRDGSWQALDLKPKYVSTHGPSIVASVLAGEGIAFLPLWGVSEHIEAGRLSKIDLEDGPLSVSGNAEMGIYLIYHPPKFRLQKIKLTVDFLQSALKCTAKNV